MVTRSSKQRAARLPKPAVLAGGVLWFTVAWTLYWPLETARAQGLHAHEPGESLAAWEIALALAHSVTLWSAVLLAGLVAFTTLVWLPASRGTSDRVAVGDGGGGAAAGGGRLFTRLAWLLFGALVLAGLVELPLYAVSGSGQRLTPALLWEAISGTRVGAIWSARLILAFSTALLMSWAFRDGKSSYRWIALGLGAAMLLTLSQLSHAAAESRLLPLAADWLHVIAASVWTGGILGFVALLVGPLRAASPDSRMRLLRKAVPRFSRVAAVAVLVLLASGIYASLLHIPSFSALIGTPYGRALIMKLGLACFVLSVGAINLMDRGREPFGRMAGAELVLTFAVFIATGFLTTITPP